MLYEIDRTDSPNRYAISSRRMFSTEVDALGLFEKDIEHWIADQPKLLLPNEEVLVIGQSIAGQAMADVLALDQFGRLVIVEIKRHPTDRATVAQLLDYAARMQGITYSQLEHIAQNYRKWAGGELYKRFQETFPESPISVPREDLGKMQRLLIVAPESDESLKRITAWLKDYGVPIAFVPFSIYADEKGAPRLFQIEGVRDTFEPGDGNERWEGHWIFNTNETHAPGAYERMFSRNVAAIYEYPNGPRNLEGSTAGDKVLAYVNQQGLRAVGTVVDGSVVPGQGIFVDAGGNQLPDEYHLRVNWEVIVPWQKAISSREAVEMGYNLPVRSVFGKLHKGQTARKLEEVLRKRGSESKGSL